MFAGDWVFEVAGVFEASRPMDGNWFLLHWDQLDQAQPDKGTVGLILTRVEPSRAVAIAKQIDQVFAAREFKTISTVSEMPPEAPGREPR